MHRKTRIRLILGLSIILLLITLLMQPWQVYYFRAYISLLFPSGWVAFQERDLLLLLQVLMLLVIIPVYLMTFVFSWKYSAERNKGKYDPDLVDNAWAEVFWWGIPIVMTTIVCVITWIETYNMDPFKPLESNKKTMTIQAVALQYKWLFIYPEEKIATTNFVAFPKEIPLHFEITADAPMNSFWLPALGGQIYAMPAMKTELHLIADKEGEFRGSSANISGEGFADMVFTAHVTSEEKYKHWVESAKRSAKNLTFEEYSNIARPEVKTTAETYRLGDPNLFGKIIDKYMHPHNK